MRYARVLCCALTLFILPAGGYASTCASPTEKAALDTRALQTELMVAALSCGEQSRYNNFVNRFRQSLNANSVNLKSYFSRVYPSNAESQLNRFITKLANAVSERSLATNSDDFCEAANTLFDEVTNAKPSEVVQVASREDFSDIHGISACSNNDQMFTLSR